MANKRPNEQTNSELPQEGQPQEASIAPSSPPGPTGPRTKRGKRRSRYNSVKHGIFAKGVLHGPVLKESEADYRNLLESFRESFQPANGFEEMRVEKLAILTWKEARAVRAEAAFVARRTEFLRQKEQDRLKANSEGAALDATVAIEGIAYSYDNPYLLDKAVMTLETMRNEIERRGFDPKVDERLLGIVYGERRCLEGVPLRYRACSERKQKTSDEADQRRIQRKFLEVLKKEIERLRSEVAAIRAREDKALSLEEESFSIPVGLELDNLLRYWTYIERSFDRTLAQLERVQRLRLGLPVPPPLKVEVR